MFVAGLLVVAAGSLACGLAPAPGVFVVGRVVTGLGAGAVLACALGLISHAFPPGPARAHATGVWGASVGAGIATGGLLTVAVDQGDSWRHAYLVVATLAVVTAALGHRTLRESRAALRRRPDLLGAALLGAGLATLLSGVVGAGHDGVSGSELGLLVGGLALLTAFVLAEARGASPMLDLALLRSPRFVGATVAAFANGAGATALAAFTPTLVQRGLGRSLLAASLVTLLFAGTSVVTALQVRRLPVHLSGGSLLIGALVGVAAGQVLLTGLSPTSSLGRLVPGLVVTGVAFGVLNAALGREAVASVPPERAAMGSGANNTSRYVGSAIGITLVSVVAGRAPAGLTEGWDHAVALTAAVSLAGAAVVALTARRQPR